MPFGGETRLLRYGDKISWLRTPDFFFFFLMQTGLELAVKIKLVVV